MHLKESFFNFRAKRKKYNPVDAKIFSEYNKFRPLGAKAHLCYVPFSSMTFCVDGKVYACSYNRKALLGNIPEQTIKEIWFGETAKILRDHHLHNDLSFGCQHCKFFFDKRKFTDLKPHEFDQYATTSPHAFPRVLEFELSNICNLECQMCSGHNSSLIRKNREALPAVKNKYDHTFLAELAEFIPHLKEAKFYGGEPFMIPLHYKIWDLMMDVNPSIEYFVITNGTHWNERIEKVLRRGRFNIAVSIDSLDPNTLRKIRKNIDPDLLMENIGKFNAICQEKRAGFTLSFTMQQDNRYDLPKMIEYCNKINAQLFISYLENPVKFAISTLKKEEIVALRENFERYKFPNKTPNQQHNFNGFEEYKNYLDQMILDYKFESYKSLKTHEKLYDVTQKFGEKIKEKPPVESYKLIPNAKVEIRNEFDKLLVLENSSEDQKSLFYKKLHVFENTFNETEQTKIYTLMLNSDYMEVFTFMNQLSLKELIDRAKDSLNRCIFT